MSSLAATPNPNPPSPIRLFNPPMGSQMRWVLPLALFGLFSTAWRRRPPTAARGRSRRRLNRRQRSFVLWGTWAVARGAVFLAYQPVLPRRACARDLRLGRRGNLWLVARLSAGEQDRGWLLPVALFATAVEHWYLLSSVPTWLPWLPITLLGATLGLSLVLALRRIPPRRWMLLARLRDRGARWESPIVPAFAALGLVVLFLTPTLWTLGSLRNANAGGHPLSGPTRRGAEIAPPPLADPILDHVSTRACGRDAFLVATVTTGDATPIIFSTGAPVMAMGGFSGIGPHPLCPKLAGRGAE